MRKNMPYMVLDITKKPGDPNAVKTGDMLLAENTKLREALKECLLYIACAESVGVGTITLNDKVKLTPEKDNQVGEGRPCRDGEGRRR